MPTMDLRALPLIPSGKVPRSLPVIIPLMVNWLVSVIPQPVRPSFPSLDNPPEANHTGNYTRPDIWSGEWTWGAVFMTRKLADEYKKAGKADWAASLLADSQSMITHMQAAVQPGKDGGNMVTRASLLT